MSEIDNEIKVVGTKTIRKGVKHDVKNAKWIQQKSAITRINFCFHSVSFSKYNSRFVWECHVCYFYL